MKAYKDLYVNNRRQGYSTWVTFALSPKASESAPATAPISRKY